LDAPGWVIPSSWANSVTGRSPARSSTRISRRRGSAIALKTSDVVAARAMANHMPISACVKSNGELFTTDRHQAFIAANTLSMIETDERHRDHAIVEQTIAELKEGRWPTSNV
jgi:hypothetical protein